jgi:KipI family sensor histidine kinase inhibitor
MNAQSLKVSVAGENSLIIYFGDTTAPQISAQVQRASKKLAAALGDLIIDQVTSYASLLLIFDPLRVDQYAIRQVINQTLKDDGGASSSSNSSSQTCLELPVYYSEESGPELQLISQNSGLSIEEIIDIHQSLNYRVYAIGFAPGFAFLGQVDERIASPRLSTPRLKVPRGAVGIADRQTAIYPNVSPGGWNLIGLCPTRMFNPEATPTMPVSVGDEVRFKAISKDEFHALGGEIGEFQ